jgi:Mn-containing catalase
MFMKALDSLGKLDDPFFGTIQPDDTVEIVYNLSQGEDARGAWNEAPFKYVANPDATGKLPGNPINPDDEHRRGVKSVRH